MTLLLLLLAAPLDRYGDEFPTGAVARMGTVRLRSPNGFNGLTFTPDGKRLLAGEASGVTVWDVASGKRLDRWALDAFVMTVRFSKNGKVLAAATSAGVMTLDPKTGRVLRRLTVPPVGDGDEEDFTLSPDGSHAVIGFAYGDAFRIIRTDTGAVVGRVDGLEGGRRTHLSFTPDGSHFVTAGKDGRLMLYSTRKAEPVRNLEPEGRGIRARAGMPAVGVITENGREVISTVRGDNGLVVRDIETGRVLRRIPTTSRASYYDAQTLIPLPGGRFIASSETGATLRLWALASGRLMREFPMPNGEMGVAFSPDGSHLALSAGNVLMVWDVVNNRRLHDQPAEQPMYLGWTRDGKRLVSFAWSVCRVWDARTGAQSSNHPGMAAALGTPWRVGDETFQFIGYDRAVTRWTLGEPAAEALTRPSARAMGRASVLAQSRDGRWVITRGRRDMPCQLIDLVGDKGTRDLVADIRISSLTAAFSPDSRLIALGTSQGEVILFDLLSGEERRRLPAMPPAPGPRHSPNRLSFSPDGRLLARLDADLAVVERWTGGVRMTLPRQGEHHTGLPTWSECGRMLALGLGTGEFVVLDTWTGAELLRRQTEQGVVRVMAFRPDGRQLATVGNDTTVLTWDLPGAPHLKKSAIGSAWDDLSASNPATAWPAMRRLIAAGDAGALAERLRPAAAPDAAKLTKLVAGLGDPAYAVREASRQALEAIGEPARAALERAKRGDSLDARRAAERLLAQLDGDGIAPARLRRLRAVEVLEHIGGKGAEAALRRLISDSDAEVSEAARASLARLAEAARPIQ